MYNACFQTKVKSIKNQLILNNFIFYNIQYNLTYFHSHERHLFIK